MVVGLAGSRGGLFSCHSSCFLGRGSAGGEGGIMDMNGLLRLSMLVVIHGDMATLVQGGLLGGMAHWESLGETAIDTPLLAGWACRDGARPGWLYLDDSISS